MAKKSIAHIVLAKTFGFIIFLVLLGLANYLMQYVPSSFYKEAVYFFNFNLVLLLTITFFGMLSEIFWAVVFPFNLVAPIVSAISSIFVVTFLYRIWNFIDSYSEIGYYVKIADAENHACQDLQNLEALVHG